MDLFYGGDPRPIGKLSFDDRSGDFIEYTSPLDIALRTLFHFRKPFPPRLDPCYLKTPIPTQPTPLSAYALGWMWGAGPLSGSSLDSLIGGPHRPQAPKPPPTPRRPLITWGDPPKDKDSAPAPATPAVAPKRPAIKKQRAPRRDARERGDLYGELSRVTRQRNDYMDRLAEGMNNAAESTQAYLNSARDAMVKEGAKASARGVWAKVT